MTANVPVLPRHPSWDEAVAYLRWLAASPFAYHLDDDATDCGFPSVVGAVLSHNADVLSTDFAWDDVWAAYAEETSARAGRA